MKFGVFIERDGVLNQARREGSVQVSPLAMEEFKINLEAVPHLKRLKSAGLTIIVTTNQPGISRGYLPRRELDRMHQCLRRAMPMIDDLLICAHDDNDHCPCRKPKPGLFCESAFKWRLTLDRSFVISDKWQDAEAARSVGSTSLLIKSPWIGSAHHDFVMPDLASIVDKILQLQGALVPVTALA